MSGFLAELTRRSVVKVGIAYLAAAWLLIQVIDTLVSMLGISDSVSRIALLLLALGLPVTLILAWIYELTPEGVRREQEIDRSQSAGNVTGRKLDFAIIGLLAVAVAYLLIDQYAFESASAPTLGSSGSEAIAVLPFVNASDDPGNVYFAEGMSDEIRGLLGRIPGLKVIGRTSSHAFKGKDQGVRQIGEVLGVASLLEGSVRKSGDRVRITTQLVNAADGTELWSSTYEKTITDVFEVQDAVATEIIEALQIHVGAVPTRGRPTANSEAYALYLKGKAAINALDYPGGMALLEQATALDPKFAEAFEALAFAYWITADTRDAVESQNLVRATSNRAIELDPGLAFAKIYARSTMLGPEYRRGTIEALEQALREYPDDSQMLEALTWLLVEMGYLEESLQLAERFVDVDPLSLVAHAYLSLGLYSVGRNDEALDATRFILTSDPVINSPTWALIGMLLASGHDDSAIEYVESAFENHSVDGAGWFRELVAELRGSGSGPDYLDQRIPEIAAHMTDQHALNWQEELLALNLYFGFLDRYYESVFATNPTDETWHYAGIHAWRGAVFRQHGFTGHPRYMELARSLSIDDVWEHRGAPDFCTLDADAWTCE